MPAPARYVVWAAAFALDLGTPWLAVGHTKDVPPHAEHLPERFGLFTIILLGESVIAVTHGIAHQEYWSVVAATCAFGGMGLTFAIWWGYFHAARAAAPRHVHRHADAVRLHVWSYAHLPFYLGLVVAFAGVQLILSEVPAVALHGVEAGLLAGALATLALGLGAIAAASPRPRSVGHALETRLA